MPEPLPKLDRYRLVRRLAAGGMAEVYLGHRLGPSGFQKRVAIKFLMPHLAADEAFLEMFLDEARLVAMLHHANLVQIFDVGTIDGRLCMVMEYVDGASLAQVHRQAAAAGAARVPPDVAAALLAQACDGLDSAHEFPHPDTGALLGFVHRDVSPQNLLVARDGVLKVADFGIAKSSTNVHVTTANELKGKLSYMAPEQIHRGSVDRRADVWALGTVLFELVAGRRLFTAETEPLLLRAVLEAPLEGPLAELPPPLVPVVAAALERDPERRTPTAGEMGRQLQGYLALAGGSLERGRVARWAAPFLPLRLPDEVTPSLPPRGAPEPVSLPSSDVELVTEPPGRPSRPWPRRAALAALAAASVGLLALLWRKPGQPPPAPGPAITGVSIPGSPLPPIGGGSPAAGNDTAGAPPAARPAEGQGGDVPRLAAAAPSAGPAGHAGAAPRALAAAPPVHAKHPRSSHRPAPTPAAGAASASEPDADDDDVGLVNPFHAK